MGKTNKQKKAERLERIQTAQVIKYLKCLGPDDMTTWNEKLEEIENATDPEMKEAATKALQIWLALKYTASQTSICSECLRQPTCYRKQEKIKQCKLFESKDIEEGSESDENI